MELKDIVEKNFEAYPDVAADIINALVYEGKETVAEENLISAPTETVYQGAERLRNQYQDLAKFEMLSGQLNMIYQIANQSDPDRYMLLRKAGYTGAAYREQYDGKLPNPCPVVELLLYWGRKRWSSPRSMRRLFRKSQIPPKAWDYIDNLKLHVWEMRRLPPEVRERFTSDMRIVVDYLAEGDSYRSDRPVKHKEALIKMIRVLSGDTNVENVVQFLEKTNINEEDEITMCELFDQYERKGRNEGIQQGIRALIATCKKLGTSFEITARNLKEQFNLSDAEVQTNMNLYW